MVRLDLVLGVLENLPNPVLVKDDQLRYVWVNPAFQELFGVHLDDLFGQLDQTVFVDRQAAQCNGGDLRVLETGEVDHADETIVDLDGVERDIITRKSRIVLTDGATFLVGILHDVTEVSSLNRELESSRTTLAAQAAELDLLARTDPLTGVLNRRGLEEAVADANAISASVVALDLDHFKLVNDVHGHKVGDEALCHIVSLVARELSDAHVLARLGGEEFAVYLPTSNADEATALAEAIRVSIESHPCVVGQTELALTASLGVTHGSGDISTLLVDADRALYAAKNAGRNRVITTPSRPTQAS